MTQIQVDCFLAAAQNRSFKAAADSLYMTAASFSRHIIALEDELGFPLFVREWKNSRLTPAGEIMAAGLTELTEEYHSILSHAASVALGHQGRLVIGLLEGQLVDETLRIAARKFETVYPGISVELRRYSFAALRDALRNGESDVAITLAFDVQEDPQLDSMWLFQLRNEMVISSEKPLAARQHLTLADFANETFIEFEKSESKVVSCLMTESCEQAGFTPKLLVVKDLEEQMQAIELGLGVSAFNENHQMCHHPGLCHIPLPELPPVDFRIAWKRANSNPAVRRLLDLLQEQFC